VVVGREVVRPDVVGANKVHLKDALCGERLAQQKGPAQTI